MKRLAFSVAVSALLSPAFASAADWTGWYAGAQLGYGDASSNVAGIGGDGGFLGFTGGYDYDFGTTVIGAAVDYDFANITVDPGSSIKSIARLKFRVGYDTGPALVYLSAGGARADAEQYGRDSGYYGGLGVDFLLDPNFSLGVELLSHRFNNYGGYGADLDVGTAAVRAVFRF